MTSRTTFLGTPLGRTVMFCVLIAALAVAFQSRVRSLFPVGNDVAPSGDDWYSYHRYAVSVVQGGLDMPAVKGPYTRPGGFGYVYFVAALYALFGIRSGAVYVAQAVLLAASVLLFVQAFRRSLSPRWLFAYGLALAVFVTVDAFRYYTFRLLSENLLIFLFSAVFLALGQLIESRSWTAATLTGLLCGACFLTRPNTVLIAPAWALLFVWRRRDRRAAGIGILFCGGLLLLACLIPWRNHVAGGAADLQVLTTTYDWPRPPSLSAAFGFYARRILYVLGFAPLLVPEYHIRPQWCVAWAGVLAFLGWSIRRRQLEELDAAALVFLAAYYGPLVAVGWISSYGTRMLIPAMPVVLYLATRSLTLFAGESAGDRCVPR